MLEISIWERDKDGKITGKILSTQSDKGFDIWTFWQQNKPKKKKNIERAATAEEANKIIKELNKAEKKEIMGGKSAV